LKIFNPYVQEVQCVQEVGDSCLPMLVFSPIIKEGKILLEQIPLPYSLFLIPYWLFKFSSPTVETVGYEKIPKRWEF